MDNADHLIKQYQPILNFLEDKTSKKFKLKYNSSYEDIINKFMSGEIDIAFLGPLPYALLKQRYAKTIPIVGFLNQEGKPDYSCSLFKLKEKSTLTQKSYKKKTIALTQALSTCGYLMAETLLNNSNKSIKRNFEYFYSGSHTQVILDVILGKAVIGSAKTSIIEKYKFHNIETISTTQLLPGFVLVANGNNISKELIKKIRQIFLNFTPLTNKKHRNISQKWGRQFQFGSKIVSPIDYDFITETLKNISIPELNLKKLTP